MSRNAIRVVSIEDSKDSGKEAITILSSARNDALSLSPFLVQPCRQRMESSRAHHITAALRVYGNCRNYEIIIRTPWNSDQYAPFEGLSQGRTSTNAIKGFFYLGRYAFTHKVERRRCVSWVLGTTPSGVQARLGDYGNGVSDNSQIWDLSKLKCHQNNLISKSRRLIPQLSPLSHAVSEAQVPGSTHTAHQR